MEGRFSVRRPAELETAPMKKVIEFFTEDQFIYGLLGEMVFPSLIWIWLMVGTPLILKSIEMEYNILWFVLSLLLWTFAILTISHSGYYRAGQQIRMFLMDRFDVSSDYSGSYVETFIKGGCSLWWKRKKEDFGGKKKRPATPGAGD